MSTIEIPTSIAASSSDNVKSNPNFEIFYTRRSIGKFSQTDEILDNMMDFNKLFFKYLNNLGISLEPIEYNDMTIDEIANLGYYKYKSLYKYIIENLTEKHRMLIKKSKDLDKNYLTAYEYFLYQCYPFIYIKYNKDNYFNVIVLKGNTYINTKGGSGERLIYFADGLETKYKMLSQDERNTKTFGSIKLKDIMPNITCDVIQSNNRGKKTVLALQYLNDIYKLTFELFKEDIITPTILNNMTKNKKVSIGFLNDYGEILFKNKSYTKKKQDNDPTSTDDIIEYTIFDLKLIGKPNSDLYTWFTNYNESNNADDMLINGCKINLNNINQALPRNTIISTFINMESITYVHNSKQLYLNFKCYQIDVDRRFVPPSKDLIGSFDFKTLCKRNSLTPQIYDISEDNKQTIITDEIEQNYENDDEDNTDDNI